MSPWFFLLIMSWLTVAWITLIFIAPTFHGTLIFMAGLMVVAFIMYFDLLDHLNNRKEDGE